MKTDPRCSALKRYGWKVRTFIVLDSREMVVARVTRTSEEAAVYIPISMKSFEDDLIANDMSGFTDEIG